MLTVMTGTSHLVKAPFLGRMGMELELQRSGCSGWICADVDLEVEKDAEEAERRRLTPTRSLSFPLPPTLSF